MRHAGDMSLEPGSSASTPLFSFPSGMKMQIDSRTRRIKPPSGGLFFLERWNRTYQMRHAGGMSLALGWTRATPLFSPSAKMQIDSRTRRQRKWTKTGAHDVGIVS